jgi:mono/diheme cytochrome c family protein
MLNLRSIVRCIALLFGVVSARAADEAPPHPLVWDAMEKSSAPKLGDGAAQFTFTVTNRSKEPVTILQVRPSCGCTTVDLPPTPWVVAPGAGGAVTALVDFRGKEGELEKALFVGTSAGPQTLIMRVKVPAMDEEHRRLNQQAALANRQAVFANECALCHAVPANGKTGGELFQAACAVCHMAPHRATMVPDLLVAREKRDAAWWTKWITEGKQGTLMPAFAEKHGGPLTAAQVDSLVEYLVQNLPTEPAAP